MSISVPKVVTVAHCHPSLETKELGYFCPGLCPSLVKGSGLEGMQALCALGACRQSRCLREVGVGGGQSIEF